MPAAFGRTAQHTSLAAKSNSCEPRLRRSRGGMNCGCRIGIRKSRWVRSLAYRQCLRRSGTFLICCSPRDPLSRICRSTRAAVDVPTSARRSMQANQIVPPWEWRHGGSATGTPSVLGFASPAAPATRRGAPSFSCGSKRYCSEMSSCEEARYYLRVCRLGTIDGDHDGRPCERLCAASPQ
jgi:hypothetical protein